MGQNFTKFLLPHHWREDEPYSFDDIKYDPQFGFQSQRRERKMIATEEEMDSCNLEWDRRDHCSHLQLEFRGCVIYNQPWYFRCKGIEHELMNCYLEEHVHDMKEFEREKRLNVRERRLKEKLSQ